MRLMIDCLFARQMLAELFLGQLVAQNGAENGGALGNGTVANAGSTMVSLLDPIFLTRCRCRLLVTTICLVQSVTWCKFHCKC